MHFLGLWYWLAFLGEIREGSALFSWLGLGVLWKEWGGTGGKQERG